MACCLLGSNSHVMEIFNLLYLDYILNDWSVSLVCKQDLKWASLCLQISSLIQGAPNPKLKSFLSHLAIVFEQSIEARSLVENEDVVGAAPTGDAPTTSEWSGILLPIKVQPILEVWRYFFCHQQAVLTARSDIDFQMWFTSDDFKRGQIDGLVQYLQCVSNGDTAVLHKVIEMIIQERMLEIGVELSFF